MDSVERRSEGSVSKQQDIWAMMHKLCPRLHTCRDYSMCRRLYLTKLYRPGNMTSGLRLAIQERPETQKPAFLICSYHAPFQARRLEVPKKRQNFDRFMCNINIAWLVCIDNAVVLQDYRT